MIVGKLADSNILIKNMKHSKSTLFYKMVKPMHMWAINTISLDFRKRSNITI